jgi:hypothetical protein
MFTELKVYRFNTCKVSNEYPCYQWMDEGAPTASQFPPVSMQTKVLEIHKHEKHFEVSHNKESHMVEVLARIYFSIIG